MEIYMSKRARLTDGIIDQVWSLFKRGYDCKDIAIKLDISQTSVLRCITAMSTASSGTFVEYTGLLKDSHYIADYANKKFNLKSEFLLAQEAEELSLTAAIICLANNIARQSVLLESIIKKFESKV